MTTLTRNQLYLLARAAAKGGDFKIEFSDRSMAIAFLFDVAGQTSSTDRWDLGDGYTASLGLAERRAQLVLFHREEA